MGWRRGVPALVVVQHLQWLGLAHLVPAVAVDNQVERGAVEESTRVLDALSARAARTVEEIARRSGMSVQAVESALGLLDLDGRAARAAAGWKALSR